MLQGRPGYQFSYHPHRDAIGLQLPRYPSGRALHLPRIRGAHDSIMECRYGTYFARVRQFVQSRPRQHNIQVLLASRPVEIRRYKAHNEIAIRRVIRNYPVITRTNQHRIVIAMLQGRRRNQSNAAHIHGWADYPGLGFKFRTGNGAQVRAFRLFQVR